MRHKKPSVDSNDYEAVRSSEFEYSGNTRSAAWINKHTKNKGDVRRACQKIWGMARLTVPNRRTPGRQLITDASILSPDDVRTRTSVV